MPRAGLTTARVVDEAARLADEEGLDALTLAALAQRLDVRQPSLYKHVAGVAQLRRGVAINALQGLASALRSAAVGKAGSEALVSMATAYREYARRHPGRYAAALRAPLADDAEQAAASAELLDVVMAVLAGYHLSVDACVDAARMLRAAIHGFVTLEAEGGFGMPREVGRSFERMVGWMDEALRAESPKARPRPTRSIRPSEPGSDPSRQGRA
jgi:AcrR family transcriptional regulator